MTEQIIEIIGLNGTVVQSSNKNLLGITGQIIDETKYMIVMYTKLVKRSIPKNSSKLQVVKDGKMLMIDGLQMLKRPYERMEIFS